MRWLKSTHLYKKLSGLKLSFNKHARTAKRLLDSL
jgi:hypothetical protein